MSGINNFFDDRDDFELCLNDAESQAKTTWEINFVADFRERYEDCGSRIAISKKQANTLRRIADWEEL